MSAGNFATTRWTLVHAARDGGSADAQAALAALCESYWYPLYAYVRRRGYPPPEAEDLTQAFFARLLAGHPFDDVHQEKGRFRSYLLASIKHFLANEWDRARALKRGGGHHITSLDAHTGEQRYQTGLADALTPAKLFDRQWALTLLDRVLQRLRTEMDKEGKGEVFEIMKPFLTEGRGALAHAEAATRLGISESAAKVAAHRLRKRYRAMLRDEIADTVVSPDMVEEELRSLFAAFEVD
jgi:RNA polymerase sigma-70 factor (ECF subfamily)